jgi:hypothetical protein
MDCVTHSRNTYKLKNEVGWKKWSPTDRVI